MNTIQSAVKEFINHCLYEKNLSDKTVKAYQIDLMQFTKFLIEKSFSVEITHITKIEIREFLESISSLKPKSIKRKIATIKAMFNYLEFEDRILLNPLRKMRINIREPKNLPNVMNIGEIRRIFRVAYSRNTIIKDTKIYSYLETYRDVVVVELLFATGARVSEIANLTTENVDVNTGSITIKGKGNKERIIQVCNTEALRALKNYQILFDDRIKNSGGFFLVNRLGKKLSDQSIRTVVKHLAVKAGIQKRITPHTFRHSFGTLLLEQDVDIKYISSLLGHSSIMTTQIYTHVNREKQKQILQMKHPRKDISMYAPLLF